MEVEVMIIEDTRLTALKTKHFCLLSVFMFLTCKLEKIPSEGMNF